MRNTYLCLSEAGLISFSKLKNDKAAESESKNSSTEVSYSGKRLMALPSERSIERAATLRPDVNSTNRHGSKWLPELKSSSQKISKIKAAWKGKVRFPNFSAALKNRCHIIGHTFNNSTETEISGLKNNEEESRELRLIYEYFAKLLVHFKRYSLKDFILLLSICIRIFSCFFH